MKFAKCYLFIIDKNDKLTIKAYNNKFIAELMYDWTNAKLKMLAKDTDTVHMRKIIRKNYG